MVDPSAFLDDFLTHLNADSLGLRLNQSPVVTGQILHGIASHRLLKRPAQVTVGGHFGKGRGQRRTYVN